MSKRRRFLGVSHGSGERRAFLPSRGGDSVSPTWRFLDSGARTAAENVALDHVLIRSRLRGGPSTLRLLQFSQECCLVGYHQAVEVEVEEGFCSAEGIVIGRRLTGGGTIYLDQSQLGWEVCAARGEAGLPTRVEDLYATLGGAVARALNDWGVPARFRPLNDLEVNGKKISGTGGTEETGVFLFQGTLLVRSDVERMMRCLRVPAAKLQEKGLLHAKDRITSLEFELGTTPLMSELKAKVASRLAEAIGVELVPAGLSGWERTALRRALPTFAATEWVHRVSLPAGMAGSAEARHRADGGLIHVRLSLDRRRNRIRYVSITGDFFAYPPRVIPDLEAALTASPATADEVRSRVEAFWDRSSPQIPGIGVRQMLIPLLRALERANVAAVRKPSKGAQRALRRS